MADGSSNSYSIRAVERVSDILDLIQRTPTGFSLVDVVEATNLPKSSAFRYLSTLEGRRYIERDAITGQFRIGPAFLPLQSAGLELLAERARPLLEELRDRFEETINLGILDGNRVSYIDIIESPRMMRLSARRGDRDPLHCTALGKAIASTLPVERVTAILEAEGMAARTPQTITDFERYFEELDDVRVQGYALDNGENEPDGRCLAVPLTQANTPIAVSLSAPAGRFPLAEVATVANALNEVAEKLLDAIGRTGSKPTSPEAPE